MKIDETKEVRFPNLSDLYYIIFFHSSQITLPLPVYILFHNMRKKFRNKHRKNKVRNNQCVISKDPGIQNGLNFL